MRYPSTHQAPNNHCMLLVRLFTNAGPAPWGTDCDDPTRRMRRSIRTFESLLGVDAPPRLHECAASAAPWAEPCGPGTMGEATEWLAEMTTRWKAEALTG